MGYTNNMTKLLNKIERRLGTRALNLPDYLKKEKWHEIIIEDTIPTFSRYFPFKIRMPFTDANRKNGSDYYLIDENMIPGNLNIIGVKDYAWDDPNNSPFVNGGVYGYQDCYTDIYSLEDVAFAQLAANQTSLFNNGLFVEFEPPNKVYIKNSANRNVRFPMFTLDILIEHTPSLTTIEPTKMETFENLATADVANFLYQELKYYQNLQSVFGDVDIKLDDISNIASTREQVIETLKEGYISAANSNQPLMYTI